MNKPIRGPILPSGFRTFKMQDRSGGRINKTDENLSLTDALAMTDFSNEEANRLVELQPGQEMFLGSDRDISVQRTDGWHPKPTMLTAQELKYLIECVNRDPRGLESTCSLLVKLNKMFIEAEPFTRDPHRHHVWKDNATDKYVWEDETNNFSTDQYDTVEDAYAVFCDYCEK